MSFSVGVRKFAGLTTAVVLGAVTLAACGGSPQEAGQGAPAGEASATQEAAQATTRAEGSTDVFIFTNGVSGSSGQGFQPDVFDSAPGDPDYSPLRELNLVTWEDEGSARVLESAADIKAAAQNGEITIERPGVVFNMPFLTWPGGRR
jgi:ABC-type phosphate transport system substrate-binding protein